MCPLSCLGTFVRSMGEIKLKEKKRDRIYEEFASRGFDIVELRNTEVL